MFQTGASALSAQNKFKRVMSASQPRFNFSGYSTSKNHTTTQSGTYQQKDPQTYMDSTINYATQQNFAPVDAEIATSQEIESNLHRTQK